MEPALSVANRHLVRSRPSEPVSGIPTRSFTELPHLSGLTGGISFFSELCAGSGSSGEARAGQQSKPRSDCMFLVSLLHAGLHEPGLRHARSVSQLVCFSGGRLVTPNRGGY